MDLNYTEEHVEETIEHFFGDINLSEETKEEMSSEEYVYDKVIELFHDRQFFSENRLEDFVAMYWFYREAFLKDCESELSDDYFDAPYLNDLCENGESELAVWLVTRGPLMYHTDVRYCRSMLFINNVSEPGFEPENIPMFQTLLDMTDKFKADDLYDQQRFSMVEECENIHSHRYFLSTIYNNVFINTKLSGLTPEILQNIYQQRQTIMSVIEHLSNNAN